MKLLLLLCLMRARARFSVRNAHIRSSTVIYVSKSHVRIKLSETCTNPEVRFLAQKYSVIHPNFDFFFLILSMISMIIQLFNSVNNSECMKQHCTPPLPLMMSLSKLCRAISEYNAILSSSLSWCTVKQMTRWLQVQTPTGNK